MAYELTLTADSTQMDATVTRSRDHLAQAFAQMTKDAAAMAAKMTQATTAVGGGFTAATSPINAFERLVVQQLDHVIQATNATARATQVMADDMQRAMRRASTATQQASSLTTRGLQSMTQGLRSLAAGFGVIVGVQAIAGFVRSTVDAGLQAERFSRTLQAATGSITDASRAMTFIVAESNRLGQSIAQMVPAFAQLAAATKNTTLEGERTRALFSALAGAGVAIGLSTEATGRAMVGLIQIISQNAIQLDEFRNQFASQIPGAMRETAKALGDMGVTATGSISEMLKLIEKQKLSVEDLMKAVTTGLQAVQRSAPDMANSAEAAFQRFSNAVLQLKADLAQSGLIDFLKNSVDYLREWVAWAGRALGSTQTSTLRQISELQGELSRLRQQRDIALQEATERITVRGMAEEPMMRGVKALDAEISAAEGRLRQLEAQMKQSRDSADAAAEARKRRNQEEADQLKRFDEERKAREDALKAAPERLKGQEALISARLKQEEAALKQSFDQQRQLADQYYQEELANTPQRVAEIAAARESDLLKLANQEAQKLEALRLDYAGRALRAELATLDASIAAADGNAKTIAGLEAQKTAAVADHAAQVAQIRAGMADFEIKEGTRATEAYIKNIERQQKAEEEASDKAFMIAVADTDRRAKEIERLEEKATRDLERELEKQEKAFETFAEDVQRTLSDQLFDIFTGKIESIGELWDRTLNFMLRSFANFAAAILSQQIVIPAIVSLAGGVAGAIGPAIGGLLGGSSAGSGGTSGMGLMDLLAVGGLANQSGMLNLFGPTSTIGLALGNFTSMLNTATANVGGAVADLFGLTQTPASGLGALAGLAGIGGGIFNALNAQGIGGMAGGAIGAAGGAAALIGSLGIGTLAIPGLQPIGLALAALAPLLGNLIDTLGAPRGPRFVLGGLGGLGVGLSGEDLSLTGALTTGRTRAERLPGGADADAIQSAMEAGIEQAIAAMVATINQVAVDPATLLIPAQEALNTGLRNALIVNSASAENFQRDIEAQLKAVAVQLAVNFLGPLSDAVRQLETQDVAAQIQRLPEVVGIAAQQWQALARAVDDLVATGQTDVSNIIPQLRDQLATFQRRMIDTAVTVSGQIVDAVIETSRDALEQIRGRTALVQALSIPALFTQPLSAVASLKGAQAQLEAVGINDTQGIQDQLSRLVGDILTNALILISDAMSQGSDSFAEMLQVILAIPPAVMALNPVFAQFQAQAQAFATVLSPLLQNIAQLEAALLPVDERVADLALTIADLDTAIAEAGDNLTLALPLYDQLRQAIMLDLQLKSEQVQAQVTLIQEQESLIATQEQLIQAQEQLLRQAEDMVLSINAAIRQQSAPAASADSILADLTALQAELAGQTGAEALDTIAEMQALLMEAQQLGQSTNNLELVRIANELLASLIPMTEQAVAEADQQISAAEQQIAQAQQQITLAEQQLIALTGTADATEALRVIQEQALAQLQTLNNQLYALFQQTSPFQSGGWVHRATGGLIPTMLEPGEGVFTGPMSGAQQTALTAMNQAFPRFAGGGIVPGSGDGDTVPALVPAGAFVLNRSASTVLQGGRGYQTGGVVTGPVVGGTVVHRTEIHLHGVTIRSDQDLRALADELDRLAARRTRRSTGGGR